MKQPRILLQIIVLLVLGASHGLSAPLYFDPAQTAWNTTNTYWSGTSGGPYNQVWVNGNEAHFNYGSTANVTLAADMTVTGLSNAGAGQLRLKADTGTRTLTFSNAVISNAGNTIQFNSGLYVVGDFTLSGGDIQTNGADPAYYSGIGAVTINAGNFFLGNNQTDSPFDATVTSLQGSGGAVTVNTPKTTGSPGTFQTANRYSTFTVNQSTTTTYAGNIVGMLTTGTISQFATLAKTGTGSLTLTGTLSGMATVSGGELNINSANTSFGDGTVSSGTSTTAIRVLNGGMLAGTGTITTLEGDNVIVDSGGKLAAGLVDTVGTTTYALGTGASLDLSATSAGALLFDLGSNATAGTTYDQIRVTSGTLELGTLDFADFTFNALGGFGAGTYTLFESTDLNATLGTLTGTIGAYDASLSISGNNVLLNVVPEPQSAVLVLLGTGLCLMLGSRRGNQRSYYAE